MTERKFKRFQHPTPKKPKSMLFFKNSYSSSKVKVVHWEFEDLTEKKDNYVYRDQLSNHMSTYNRMGNQDVGCRQGSETHCMLKEVFLRQQPKYALKPLVNFTSYPCTDTVGRNKLMKTVNLAQLPPDYGVMDYLSTNQEDYRNPFPSVAKPLTMPKTPWMLNRTVRSDCTQNTGTAPPPGNYQWLDTHTPIAHIRRMRLHRYQSFDPCTCLSSFPNVPIPDDPDLNRPLDRKY